MSDRPINITDTPDDFFLHRKAILLYTGRVIPEQLRPFKDAGFQLYEVRPTREGLASLRDIRADDSLRSQLFLIFEDPEDLAAQHSWREFWRNLKELNGLTTVLIANRPGTEVVQWGQDWMVQEVFPQNMSAEAMIKRINQLVDLQVLMADKRNAHLIDVEYQVPLVKRIFDILVAGTVLIILSPLLLLVMMLIKLESKGPIFYISKRVGSAYRMFDFYKFRSMRTDADQMVQEVMHLNQYGSEEETETAGQPLLVGDDMSAFSEEVLISDESILSEDSYRTLQRKKADNVFFKIEKDPRVTRVGRIIRNSSIDELPQLFNVLKGDMSIVGNRPLPLYEAEQLITDAYTERFNAAAGITGLWQVTDRGKAGVSSNRRKLLDVKYAKDYSIWLDFRILFMTLPALFQKSDV